MPRIFQILSAIFVAGMLVFTPALQAQETKTQDKANETDQPKSFVVKVADGDLQFEVSGNWKSVQPKSRMLESELQIPKVDQDEQNGRLTIMGAGGSIEANIVRWQQQFTQPDGSDTAEKTKTEIKTIDGQKVNIVDITGTFMDAPGGPFSGQPKVERENYRMLAAIVETENNGNYFVKFYGPKATVDKNAKAFKKMIESLKVAQ